MKRSFSPLPGALPALLLVGWLASAGTLVQFRTPLGTLEVELFDQEKPVTVANFKRYAESGIWTNMFIHRLIPGFVAQGGGFRVTDPGTTNVWFESVPDFPQITNEFNVGPRRPNVFGTIAMAKIPPYTNTVVTPPQTNIVGGVTNVVAGQTNLVVSGGPDSASREWFFNLGDNSDNLDDQNGGFTVFGQVVGPSTNVLHLLNTFTAAPIQLTNRLYNIGGTGFPFDSRPNPGAFPLLRAVATFDQIFTNALFVDVSLLEVGVTPRPDGGRDIRWKPVSGGTNLVEFTRVFPPQWQVLTNVVRPTGPAATATDPTPDPSRFYRVRIAY